MDKLIRKAKKQQSTLWKKTDKNIFNAAQIILGYSVLSSFLDLILTEYFTNIIKDEFTRDMIKIWVAVLLCVIGTFVLNAVKMRQNEITPYKPINPFAGLYSIEGSAPIQVNVDSGLIRRQEEIIYLNNLVNKYLNENSGERGICLVGKSGSGKSTIINLLENADKEGFHKSTILLKIDIKYKSYNFSDKYDYFEQYLQDEIADNYIEFLSQSQDFFLIILDHFERFFELDANKKKVMKSIIKKISMKNVVLLFSLKEEYFLQFQYEFNINSLFEENRYTRNGIIEFNNLELKNDINYENILICQNDEMYLDSAGKINSRMKNACDNAFIRNSDIIFNKYKDFTLIQKQIIFNLLKNEEARGTDLNIFINSDVNEVMKRYFDVQLCSTANYFDAARIMYLLTIGRLSNIRFSLSNIEDALCIFEKKQKENISKCMEQLHNLQLIKRLKYNNNKDFEIAHDYIATAYDAYAHTELKMEVISALDTYKIEYIKSVESDKSNIFEKKAQYFSGLCNRKFGLNLSALLFYLFSTILFVFNYQYDKTLNVIPYMLSLVSINYVYQYYSKITRYYKKSHIRNKIFYFLAILFGAFAPISDRYWLLCFGIGNSFNAINSLIISYDKEISYSGSILHRGYGYRAFCMGILLVFSNQDLGYQYELVKVVAMSCLLGYSYLSHLNQEYFYTRVVPLIYCPNIDKHIIEK